jgi:hypothetical protein
MPGTTYALCSLPTNHRDDILIVASVAKTARLPPLIFRLGPVSGYTVKQILSIAEADGEITTGPYRCEMISLDTAMRETHEVALG